MNEAENALLIRQALEQSLSQSHHSTSKREFQNILGIIQNFINRAGQKFPGQAGIETLREEVQIYTEQHCHDRNINIQSIFTNSPRIHILDIFKS